MKLLFFIQHNLPFSIFHIILKDSKDKFNHSNTMKAIIRSCLRINRVLDVKQLDIYSTQVCQLFNDF